MVLDYRSPQTREHRVKGVIAALTQDEVSRLFESVLKILAGIPLSLLGPFVVAWFIKIIDVRSRLHLLGSFGEVLAVCCVLLLPLMFWYMRRERGEILLKMLEYEPVRYDHTGHRAHSAALMALFVEVTLLGPRLLWSVIDRMRVGESTDPATRTSAARVVVTLLKSEAFIDIRSLASKELTIEAIPPAIKYLRQLDWIQASRNRNEISFRWSVRNQLRRL